MELIGTVVVHTREGEPVGVDIGQDGIHLGINFEREGGVRGREFGEVEGSDLDQGLLYLDHLCIHQFVGASVQGVGTFHGNDVTHLDAEAGPSAFSVLGIALAVLYTVDVNGTGLILYVEVAVLLVGNLGYGTAYAEGTGTGGDDLGDGGNGTLGLFRLLDHIDVLGLAVALDGDGGFTGFLCRGGGDGEGSGTGAAGSGSDGNPIYLGGGCPAAGGGEVDGLGPAFRGNAHVGLVYLDVVQIVIGLFLAGCRKSEDCEQGSKNTFKFHKKCRC